MACNTCDHTMQTIGVTCDQDGARVFWCPRCGTIRTTGRFEGDDMPKLVERCRKLQPLIAALNAMHLTTPQIEAVIQCWTAFGIAESINTPEDRK